MIPLYFPSWIIPKKKTEDCLSKQHTIIRSSNQYYTVNFCYNTAVKVTPVKTHKITIDDKNLLKVLDKYILTLKENSVVAVTSKIVSITEGRLVKMVSGEKEEKDKLIKKESQYYLPRNINKYNVSFTITNNLLSASAGIDESNGNGYYIFWPKNPQKSADKIREYLRRRLKLKHVGVIITDSKTTPLRWGVTGSAIAHSGFKALKDYIGEKDLFGRDFVYEKLNIADSLSAASVAVMGEGKEQTPLAVIEDIPFVEFQDRNPSKKELEMLKISLEEDLFAPLLTSVKWRKGRKNYN